MSSPATMPNMGRPGFEESQFFWMVVLGLGAVILVLRLLKRK